MEPSLPLGYSSSGPILPGFMLPLLSSGPACCHFPCPAPQRARGFLLEWRTPLSHMLCASTQEGQKWGTRPGFTYPSCFRPLLVQPGETSADGRTRKVLAECRLGPWPPGLFCFVYLEGEGLILSFPVLTRTYQRVQ